MKKEQTTIEELKAILADQADQIARFEKETQIEAALERVRAATMTMHKSEELADVASLVFRSLNELEIVGIKDRFHFALHDENAGMSRIWLTQRNGHKISQGFDFPLTNLPPLIQKVYDRWKNTPLLKRNELVDNTIYKGKDLDDFLAIMVSNPMVAKEKSIQTQFQNKPEQLVQNGAFFSHGVLVVTSDRQFAQPELRLLQRFAKAFEQTYTRFLDLQKAEAQTREAEIQLALERVRARTMAMQSSTELVKTAQLMFDQLTSLGVNPWVCAFTIFRDGTSVADNWASGKIGTLDAMILRHDEDPVLKRKYDAWKKGIPLYVKRVEDIELKKHLEYMLQINAVEKSVEELKSKGMALPEATIFHSANFKYGYILLSTPDEIPEFHDILIRFAKAFEQTYTRFLDLQKAEAQSREAQIEAALERVRSASMAMHQSSDLFKTAEVLFKQIQKLGANLFSCGFALCKEDTTLVEQWMYALPVEVFNTHQIDHGLEPVHHNLYKAWKSKKPIHTEWVKGKTMDNMVQFLMTDPIIKENLEKVASAGIQFPMEQKIHGVPFYHGFLLIITIEDFEETDIFVRFAKIFEQTYTRFLDLQKAEAQAREVQIEVALERVRAKGLAMHHTDELEGVIQIVFEQLKELDILIDFSSISTNDYDSKDMNFWMAAGEDVYTRKMQIPFIDHPIHTRPLEALTKGNTFLSDAFSLEEMREYYEHIFRHPEYRGFPAERKQRILSSKGFYRSATISKHTTVAIVNYRAYYYSTEENEILKRFGKVFEQTYTRFLDLQKAEAQAREAQIEAALERVRAASMAMHETDDLKNVVEVLFEQFKTLEKEIYMAFIGIYHLEEKYIDQWFSPLEGITDEATSLRLPTTPWEETSIKEWKSGKEITHYSVRGKGAVIKYAKEVDAITGFNGFEKYAITQGAENFESTEFNHKYGTISIVQNRKPKVEEIELVKRFGKSFEQCYTRFLDLQKAEAQARKAQIEAALERVRARTMAMHQSEELPEAAQLMFEQFKLLGIEPWTFTFCIFRNGTSIADNWASTQVGPMKPMVLQHEEEPVLKGFYEAWKLKKPLHIEEIKGQRLADHYQYMLKIQSIGESVTEMNKQGIFLPEKVVFNCGNFKYGYVMFGTHEAQPEYHDIFIRFTKVFEQTYTRFLDLQKAEAQAREAQIEAALERVRSASMAMHKSDELATVALTFFNQVEQLGIPINATSVILVDEAKESYQLYFANEKSIGITSELAVNDFWFAKESFRQLKKGIREFTVDCVGAKLQGWIDFVKKEVSLERGLKLESAKLKKSYIHTVRFHNLSNTIFTSIAPFSETDLRVLRRMTKVFGMSYTRFLDLQKAEAQAREAQIEAAMERIRSRAIAMRSSEELKEVIIEMRRQIDSLGQLDLEASVIHLYTDRAKMFESFAAVRPPGESGEIVIANIRFPVDAMEQIEYMIEMYHSDQQEYTIEFDKSMAEEWQEVMVEYAPMIAARRVGFVANRRTSDNPEYWNFADFSGGSLLLVTHSPASEDTREVLRKAAQVFDQAYTRFLDLQRAEALARESQIEAALERIRSASMAMHKSDELSNVATILFDQMVQLGLDNNGCGILIMDDGPIGKMYYSLKGKLVLEVFPLPVQDDPQLNKMYNSWKDGAEYLMMHIYGEALDLHHQKLEAIFKQFNVKQFLNITEEYKNEGVEVNELYAHHAYFSHGALLLMNDHEVDGKEILIRFAKVFEQTYTRFLDLQKAEAQAREAQIEAALERVRSKTMAMRHSDELREASYLLDQEVRALGIRTWGCAFNIYREDDSIEWFGNEQGMLPQYIIPRDGVFKEYYDIGQSGREIYIKEYKDEACIKHYENMSALPIIGDILRQLKKSNGSYPTYQIDHVVYFRYGYLLFITTEFVPAKTHDIFKRFAKVFEQAYIRFLDLQKAENQSQRIAEERDRLEKTLDHLKSTQAQLIQAEKMASLGELTAGIAHEIQNPLNFVNNFADVSTELIDEAIEEMDTDPAEAKDILNDLKLNLEKINHHGKRADSIVKGMLQHSRAETGEKVPTDINALCDEYMRLAYHGLRAKDKSFNADYVLDLDDTIGKINVVPQDISRVILNIVTNAFQACADLRSRQEKDTTYAPKVTCATRSDEDQLTITISDNGGGIPQDVIDKIFQPFFTTKPTGQGTGLGLSMAYDIVKAHGGELSVESEYRIGTIFTIKLKAE